MKLIVGLGNPGSKYAKHRHNIGFMALDHFAQTHHQQFLPNKRFLAQLIKIENRKSKIVTLLTKPQTLMNNSGQAVQKLMQKYKCKPADLLVIYDDIDLAFGTIRVRRGGSSAGHKGMQSIIDAVGNNFWRLRLGIASSRRQQIDATNFVLANFTTAEINHLNKIFQRTNSLIADFANGKINSQTLATIR